ncbi:MAG: tRNA (adenosine(37)-N6)-dimethylallyltransferase MiaA [Gammaproteobacteria bacterium]|nr:tRNA (adenosine(37)-N6)-dimethylallyltransferase MiaA [Gammaproteobacteria bacterium]
MDKAILLMGATATGKTDLAVELVQRFPLEIISVDSALIYREMDIGTAKPSAEILHKAPHFLIDILDPAESWSVWDFMRQAQGLISEINQRGHMPLLVGGSMMYFNALEHGMHELPVADEQLRQSLNQRLRDQGLPALYAELAQVDADTAARLKPSDTQRILRALEVYQLSGQPMSLLLQQQARPPAIDFKRLMLDVAERGELHRRIELRFQRMLEQGFEQEVRRLRQRGDLNLDMPSMRCVGYRQMWRYLDGEIDRPQMIDQAVAATRQLAKRQLTWLRKYQDVKRIDYQTPDYDSVYQFLGAEI